MIWFTSDTHFGHQNIIKFCDRPFESVDHMNSAIVNRWNEMVAPGDTVYHLGDVALGQLEKSLPIMRRLHGYKILIPGNHDRIYSTNASAYRERFLSRYEEVFDSIRGEVWKWHDSVLGDAYSHLLLSHLPYDGDSHDGDRYEDQRPLDHGDILLHGHTHTKEQWSRSKAGSLQIHVGQDAWDYRPVSLDAILVIMEAQA